MRVIILADSLSTPIPNLDAENQLRYFDVYPYILKEHFKGIHDVNLSYVGELDSEKGIGWSQKAVAFHEPDIVIYHIGINDCAPRLFKKNSKSIIHNPLFKKITSDFFLKILSKYRYIITKYRHIVYVKEEDFEKILHL